MACATRAFYLDQGADTRFECTFLSSSLNRTQLLYALRALRMILDLELSASAVPLLAHITLYVSSQVVLSLAACVGRVLAPDMTNGQVSGSTFCLRP